MAALCVLLPSSLPFILGFCLISQLRPSTAFARTTTVLTKLLLLLLSLRWSGGGGVAVVARFSFMFASRILLLLNAPHYYHHTKKYTIFGEALYRGLVYQSSTPLTRYRRVQRPCKFLSWTSLRRPLAHHIFGNWDACRTPRKPRAHRG